ncbi:MAG: response regulator [Candidatus Hydrogenedentes bacterium]|nr:response regulator [Candidatus Hydrogenedentota bacterium]
MTQENVRVLVVDDELGMREGCRKILEPEGYIVESAEDGQAGLELFQRRGDFAIALVDLNMPRMGGMKLIGRLRELDEDVVIFVITAYAAIETAVEATRRGAYGYIPKPFTPDELLLPVRNGIERRALAIEAKRLREERERRLLEVAFERTKASTIISCMTDGVLVINRDKQIVLRNNGMMRILPSCATLSLSSPLSALECPELEKLIEEVLSTDTGPVIASREVALDRCVYMVNASPVLEPNGDVMGAVAVLRDITALKKLDVAKSMFISMVAHEVKNPLAAVENYLTVILKGYVDGEPEKQRDMLERSMVRLNTLRTMVSELINLTAIETGNFTVKRSVLGLTQVVTEALDACRERAEGKKQELSFSCANGAEDVQILADRDSLFIVCTNLIDNAIKYTPEGGAIRVQVAQNGAFLKLSVEDNGIGMSDEESEHVFEEFFRVKNRQTVKEPGTGLGLSLVKRLVEMHDGAISLRSTPGAGSTFTLSLPIAARMGM